MEHWVFRHLIEMIPLQLHVRIPEPGDALRIYAEDTWRADAPRDPPGMPDVPRRPLLLHRLCNGRPEGVLAVCELKVTGECVFCDAHEAVEAQLAPAWDHRHGTGVVILFDKQLRAALNKIADGQPGQRYADVELVAFCRARAPSETVLRPYRARSTAPPSPSKELIELCIQLSSPDGWR